MEDAPATQDEIGKRRQFMQRGEGKESKRSVKYHLGISINLLICKWVLYTLFADETSRMDSCDDKNSVNGMFINNRSLVLLNKALTSMNNKSGTFTLCEEIYAISNVMVRDLCAFVCAALSALIDDFLEIGKFVSKGKSCNFRIVFRNWRTETEQGSCLNYVRLHSLSQFPIHDFAFEKLSEKKTPDSRSHFHTMELHPNSMVGFQRVEYFSFSTISITLRLSCGRIKWNFPPKTNSNYITFSFIKFAWPKSFSMIGWKRMESAS